MAGLPFEGRSEKNVPVEGVKPKKRKGEILDSRPLSEMSFLEMLNPLPNLRALLGASREIGGAVVDETRKNPLEVASGTGIPLVSDVADVAIAGRDVGRFLGAPSRESLSLIHI